MRNLKHYLTIPIVAWLLATAGTVGCGPSASQQQASNTPIVPESKTERYAMVVGLKPEKIEYYRKLHANPWPSVLDQITRSRIQNYSIHLVELKPGEYYLFGYLE